MHTKKRNIFVSPCIYKDDAFTIEHTTSFNIPGYLILFFNKNIPLDKQCLETLSRLGNVIALTTLSIKAVIKTNYVYCLSFGENLDIPHFHLFPRTDAIKQEYQFENINSSLENSISGPDLFAWILKTKKGRYQNLDAISRKISNKFKKQLLQRSKIF